MIYCFLFNSKLFVTISFPDFSFPSERRQRDNELRVTTHWRLGTRQISVEIIIGRGIRNRQDHVRHGLPYSSSTPYLLVYVMVVRTSDFLSGGIDGAMAVPIRPTARAWTPAIPHGYRPPLPCTPCAHLSIHFFRPTYKFLSVLPPSATLSKPTNRCSQPYELKNALL